MSHNGLELTNHTEMWLIKNPVVQKYPKELMEINMSSKAKRVAKSLSTWRDPATLCGLSFEWPLSTTNKMADQKNFFKPRNRRLSGFLLCLRFIFFFSFIGDYIQTSADDVPWMMSSSANYRPFLSSFRHIPPQESFVKLSN